MFQNDYEDANSVTQKALWHAAVWIKIPMQHGESEAKMHIEKLVVEDVVSWWLW